LNGQGEQPKRANTRVCGLTKPERTLLKYYALIGLVTVLWGGSCILVGTLEHKWGYQDAMADAAKGIPPKYPPMRKRGLESEEDDLDLDS
jgi:hypothetical protein